MAVPPRHAPEQDDDRGNRMDREEHEPSERRDCRDDRQKEPFQNVKLAPMRNTRGGTIVRGWVKPDLL